MLKIYTILQNKSILIKQQISRTRHKSLSNYIASDMLFCYSFFYERSLALKKRLFIFPSFYILLKSGKSYDECKMIQLNKLFVSYLIKKSTKVFLM